MGDDRNAEAKAMNTQRSLSNFAEVVYECLTIAFREPERITVSEWANREGYFAQSESFKSEEAPARYSTDDCPMQKEPQDELTNPEVQVHVWLFASRMGKALDIETPIATSDGWVMMRDIRVGDTIFDERGFPTTVIAVSEITHGNLCFEILFSDGAKIIADKDHQWRTIRTHRASRKGKDRDSRRRIKEIGIRTTSEISRTLRCENNSAHAIPLAGVLKPNNWRPSIDAYSLGVWLGDGDSKGASITCGDADLEEMSRLLETDGREVSVKRSPGKAPKIGLDKVGRFGPFPGKFRKSLEDALVWENKHIPNQCLFASADYRIALLQGLMDTDGSIDKGGFCEFSSSREGLAKDVLQLIRGLGMKPIMSKRWAKCQNGNGGFSWRLQFFPSLPVFRLSRKLRRLRASKRAGTFERRIVSVIEVPSRGVKCIQVDSPSSLYLAGESLIPTHNTRMWINVAGYFIDQEPCGMMAMYPTQDDADSEAKERLQPVIEATPVLQGKVREAKGGSGENTIRLKKFRGGFLAYVGSNSPSKLRRRAARVLFADEIDGYKASSGKEGGPIGLLFNRAKNFRRPVKILSSTPTIKNHSAIEEWFLRSDQRKWFVPCKGCGEYQTLKWSRFKWPGKDRAKTKYYCELCEYAHSEVERERMIRRGEWRATAAFNGVRGYFLPGFYSIFPHADSMKGKMHEFAEEVHVANHSTNKREDLRRLVNTFYCESYAEEADIKTPWSTLLSRRETYAEMPK